MAKGYKFSEATVLARTGKKRGPYKPRAPESDARFAARFWARVDKAGPVHPVLGTPCWPWTGRRSRRVTGFPYGLVKRSGRQLFAHRAAWVLRNGAIPEAPGRGWFVCHHCDNPPCCNPEHLFLGTNLDNMLDMKRKGRAGKTGGAHKGEAHHNARLSAADVGRVRALHKEGYSHRAIARLLDGRIKPGAVGKILRGETWRSVP